LAPNNSLYTQQWCALLLTCGVFKRRPSLFHQFRSRRSTKRIRRFGPFISAKTGVRGAQLNSQLETSNAAIMV
jgi:hypothetical protein